MTDRTDGDAAAEAGARMVCRVYLRLFDAPGGRASVSGADARGPREAAPEDLRRAEGVVRHLLVCRDVAVVERVGGEDFATLADRLVAELGSSKLGLGPRAEALRAELARFDRGEAVAPGTFARLRDEVRSGGYGPFFPGG